MWITLRPLEDALRDAVAVDARVTAGETLALAGMTVAVKDNIDVRGLPTTAACPAFSYDPDVDAVAVANLLAAGAIVLGKANLDQFATGLVGTRSPYGAVRDVRDPSRISGGSSSGSAVAVALGIADIGLATDTAGSGRVPAALQGIVGVKFSRGLVSTRGVVPACRGLDCVSLLARDLGTVLLAGNVIVSDDEADPYSRGWPSDAPLAAPERPRVGIAKSAHLQGLSPSAQDAYELVVRSLVAQGADVMPVDPMPFLAASALLYDGAFVAPRYAAVGAFLDAHPDEVDPVVAQIIRRSCDISAPSLAADQERLALLKRAARHVFADVDALVMPTTTRHPTIAEVAADPLGVNAELGRYSHFANLLDLCAVAVPAGEADEAYFGVTVLAPAFHDRVAADIAALLCGGGTGVRGPGPSSISLAVFGAHLLGQPLNHQLSKARLVSEIETAPCYRLYALDTRPEKPGLVRVSAGGAGIRGELWDVPPTVLATLLARLPPPLALGKVRLADGREVTGFLCENAGLDGACDITDQGSWRRHLKAQGLTTETLGDEAHGGGGERVRRVEVHGVPAAGN